MLTISTMCGSIITEDKERVQSTKRQTMRKMTATKIVKDEFTEYGWTWKEDGEITCEVTGEMDTGTKVWTDIKTGKQYFLTRLNGVYTFFNE